ncbi:MAG: chemotaxis protein CheC [Lachnospiraceae bacterium]|nr:chemotaxis protein CheC [Lachnospiraceae bacterium]
MSKIDLNEVSEMQFDILAEIGNIGAGNATTALSQMMNQKLDMRVPQVELLPFDSMSEKFGGEESILVGIMLGLEGDVSGMMMFMFEETSAHHLVNSIMGNDIEKMEPFSEIELSALNEIGNIVSGAYLNSLALLTNLKIISTVPSMAIDMAGAILSVPAIQFGKVGDKVLMIKTQFGDDEFVNGYFLLIPELESYEKILNSLGM